MDLAIRPVGRQISTDRIDFLVQHPDQKGVALYLFTQLVKAVIYLFVKSAMAFKYQVKFATNIL